MAMNIVEIMMIFFCRLALSLGGWAGHRVYTMFVVSKEIQIPPSKQVDLVKAKV